MRYGIFRQSPVLSLFVVLTLGVSIGTISIVLGFLSSIWFDSLPYRDADHLVTFLDHDRELLNPFSPPAFRAFREGEKTLEQISLYRVTWGNLTGLRTPLRTKAAVVSGNFFRTLGVDAEIGRTFTPEDDQRGGPKVALISYGFWQSRFAGDANVLGKSVVFDGVPYLIIGVMPREFGFPNDEIRVWLTINVCDEELYDEPRSRVYHVVARLGAEASLVATQDASNIVLEGLQRHFGADRVSKARVIPLVEQVRGHIRPGISLGTPSGNVRQGMLRILATVSLLLLTAWASVWNLLLIRGEVRRRETAVMMALGAPATRIVRGVLTDSAALAAGAALVGFMVAWQGNLFVNRLAPAVLPLPKVPHMSVRVFLISVALAYLSVAVPSLIQCARQLRLEPRTVLTGTSAGLVVSSRFKGLGRIADIMVVGQYAIAALLLFGAGLLLTSFYRLSKIDPGFDTTNLLVVEPFYRKHYPIRPEPLIALRQARAGLEALPWVESVTQTSDFPLGPKGTRKFKPYGGIRSQQDFTAQLVEVSPGYIAQIGISLASGRSFSRVDTIDGRPVAIIDERTARELWPGENAIGQKLQLQTSIYDPPWRIVVGVVKPVRNFGLSDRQGMRSLGQIYLPLSQREMRWPLRTRFVIKFRSLPADASGEIRRRVAEFAPNMPLEISSLSEILQRYDSVPRFYMATLTLLAVLTALLAFTGSFSVLNFRAYQRRHEIGVRMAVGATKGNIGRLIARKGISWAAIGIVLGSLAALLATRLLANMLYGVQPSDPFMLMLVAGTLLVVALLASLAPAKLAASCDPNSLLRQQG